MLEALGVSSLEALLDEVIPQAIRFQGDLDIPAALSEREALQTLSEMAAANQDWRSYIGMGYHDCLTPSVILRNLLENPGWYTAYTPYQAEIAQGRLEALLVFQTMVQDLTGMEISNSSLLDEATAAAEAMTMAHRISRGKRGSRFFAASDCHPQVLGVLQTRALPLGIEVTIGDPATFSFEETQVFGALLQYPATDGRVFDHAAFCQRAHDHGAMVTVAADLLSLTLLRPPGEFGADIVIGNSQRLGVPLGYGGPHAAFLATREAHKRQVPGRIIGVSVDADGNPALRMALQTREQHIRRQKATSNICTAQVLLAVTAAMYGVWHGPEGLTEIATRVHDQARRIAAAARGAGLSVSDAPFFDTVRIAAGDQVDAIVARAAAAQINLRRLGDSDLTISLNETVTEADLTDLAAVLGGSLPASAGEAVLTGDHRRTSAFMTHPFFHRYRSETEMMRYLHRLEARDLALNTAMIPLGSCTMKLNAASEMIPVTWRGFGGIHPYAPIEQTAGYQRLFENLEEWLQEVTGFDAISLQPNAGSQGEYAGLLAIRGYHHASGNTHRDVCLIPSSAHGTNPASAVMAGMKVVVIKCDAQGNIDLDNLRASAEKHSDRLSALMVTYPSTHGVFEEAIREICSIVHEHGGQVYMDGANMNAMVGLCRPGDFGADVCHLNLHKTMAIPHGGGGPGMGPIGVKAHLAPYLPSNPLGGEGIGPVSAANWGSPSILPISWGYLAMLGRDGVRIASEIAILSANYVADRLKAHYPVLYTGPHGRIAHECILDLRHLKDSAGVSVDDVAKRLMDYGFHAPTMSWPVTGTLMVEPTESEALVELDRFCDAMISIRDEIRAIEEGRADRSDNVLHNAPHTAAAICSDSWDHPYSRAEAAFPARGALPQKFWPVVRRVDNVYGDRNLACSCQAWMPAEEVS
jgi:glycine dehydrogenase